MGDLSIDKKLMEDEEQRIITFNNKQFVKTVEKILLVKAGFYFVEREAAVKCFSCDLTVKASDLISSTEIDFMKMHKEKKPECHFVQNLPPPLFEKYKTFRVPSESLRFEKCRLDTFIDWPVSFISPIELAKDGFYFLRISDHCACIYCKGIIGAWEEGDTPRGEHKKHFGRCPFITGSPVGNIPMAECNILLKYTNRFIMPKGGSSWESRCDRGSVDVTGLGRETRDPGKISHKRVTQKLSDISLEDIGLLEYKGPEYKPYLTFESRLETYKHWPDTLKQRPRDLAEAGFYHCAPADHVRCFHCGYGICNWEKVDDPWEMHAYWYPKCNFVVLTKGLDFINKVRKGKPIEANDKTQRPVVTERDLDCLMELDVIRAIRVRDFPERSVRGALRKRLEETGLPFMCLEVCLDAVFAYVEEETRQFLHETYEDETSGDQDITESSPRQTLAHTNSSDSSSSGLSDTASVLSNGELNFTSLPELPTVYAPAPILPLPQLRAHVPLTYLPPLPQPSTINAAQDEVMTVTGHGRLESPSVQNHYDNQEHTQPSNHSSQPDCTSRPLSPKDDLNGSSSRCNGLFAAAARQRSCNELQEELDRVKDSMMCKVCMDAEMSIIFLPCAHMATCASCTINLSFCPVCREQIKFTIKPILS